MQGKNLKRCKSNSSYYNIKIWWRHKTYCLCSFSLMCFWKSLRHLIFFYLTAMLSNMSRKELLRLCSQFRYVSLNWPNTGNRLLVHRSLLRHIVIPSDSPHHLKNLKILLRQAVISFLRSVLMTFYVHF